MEPSAKKEGFFLWICDTVGGSAFEVCQRLLSALAVNPLTCTGGLLWMRREAEHMRILKLSTATKTSDKMWSFEAVGVIVSPPGSCCLRTQKAASTVVSNPKRRYGLTSSCLCAELEVARMSTDGNLPDLKFPQSGGQGSSIHLSANTLKQHGRNGETIHVFFLFSFPTLLVVKLLFLIVFLLKK